MSFNREKAIHLLFREVTPAVSDPAEDLVLRLREFRQANDDVLTDDEYEACRKTVIAQIVGRVEVPRTYVVALPILFVGCIALIAWGLSVEEYGGVIGGFLSALTCVALWRGLVRDYAAKRALPRSSRLEIVERLLYEQLITESEATQYRDRIGASFPSDAV